MARLTPEGEKIVTDIATRIGVSRGAVETLLFALVEGRGTQAQFDHPELGGMGQWSVGGMTMIGDMFNNALKAKVDAICSELAGILRGDPSLIETPSYAGSQRQSNGPSLFVGGSGRARDFWPAELGTPSSVGRQNDMSYAIFPEKRRLVIEVGGQLTIYDTGDHHISGVSQQQSGDRSLTFVSQLGTLSVAELRKLPSVSGEGDAARSAAVGSERRGSADLPRNVASPGGQSAPSVQAAGGMSGETAPTSSAEQIIALIRKLAELRQDGILSVDEFEAKKAELLARL
jgi:hypothetical protein